MSDTQPPPLSENAIMRGLLDHETERRLGDVGRRLDGAATRAGIVVAAALVIAALPAPWPSRWVTLGFAGFAVLFAWVSSLTFRNGDEVPVATYVKVLNEHDIESLSSQIFDFKRDLLYAEEAAMTIHARQLTISYVYLGLAAASALLTHVLLP